LVATPANMAADDIATRIRREVRDVRMLRVHATSRDPATIPAELRQHSNLRESEGQQAIFKPRLDDLSGYNVIVCTLATAPLLDLQEHPDLKFDWLIVDEAAQATEPQVLLAATLLRKETDRKNAGQLLLCGDPCQLRAVLAQGMANESGLAVSLMERLLNSNPLYRADPVRGRDPRVTTQLRNQYRAVPALVQIPSDLFYDGSLKPIRQEKTGQHPLSWITVESPDRSEPKGTSRFNELEITAVVRQAKRHLENGTPVTALGIISPYAYHNDCIKEELKKQGAPEIDVGSVEQWQGRERDIIIYSAVRHDPADWSIDREGGLGHVGDPRRLCVAISRARNQMIIVGSPFTQAADPNWATVISNCLQHDSITGLDAAGRRRLQEKISRMWSRTATARPAAVPPSAPAAGRAIAAQQ
jgi:helicase MOV-10